MLKAAMMNDTDRYKGSRGDTRRRGARGPKKATPAYLERSALYYLERYASSVENLRRLLLRKVERSAQFHGTDRREGAEAVEDIISRLRATGILDDATYAQGRVATLHRAGHSRRAIRTRLAAKGVARETIDAALMQLEDAEGDADLTAAVRYARKRRLGPYRSIDREANRERDLAALFRKGFSPDTARHIIDAPDSHELEEEAETLR